LFDDTDEWLYPFNASEDYVLTAKTEDLYGYANLNGDSLSLVAITMTLDDNASAAIRIDELSANGSQAFNVKFYADPNEDVPYEVFIERDFKPSIGYALALISTVAFGVAAIWRLYRKVERAPRSPSGEIVAQF